MERSKRALTPTTIFAEYRDELERNARRAQEASDAAARKRKRNEDANLELRELAESLVAISNIVPTEDAIKQVRDANDQFKKDLGELQSAYVYDIDDERRKTAMQNFELKTLSTFGYALYGEFGVRLIENAYPGGNALRRFFEDYTGDQCQGALGATRPFRPGTSVCWICGLTIPATSPSTPPHGLSMECEHVFPIAQAIFFIDLYRGVKTPRAVVHMVQVEYDWSHRVCNQIKSDTHFLEVDPKSKDWKLVSDDIILKFLQDIYVKSDMYLPNNRGLFRSQIDKNGGLVAWQQSRLPVIKQRVIDVLNAGFGGFAPGIFTILSAASALDRFDREFDAATIDALLGLRGRPSRERRGARRDLRKILGKPKKRKQTQRVNKHRTRRLRKMDV